MAKIIKGKSFQVSDTGLVAMRLRYFCDGEDDALSGIPASYRGLLRRGHNGGTWSPDDEKWIVDVTYQGLLSGDPGEDFDQYEIAGEFREEPIEAFPDRASLVRDYGGYLEEGRLKFPETLPTKTNAGTGLSGAKSSAAQNPFFGLTSYPVYYEIATHTYIRKTVPGSVHKRKGSILASLPGGFSYDGDAKAWFVDAPLVRKAGNAWSITERFKEIDALKHIRALYALIKK